MTQYDALVGRAEAILEIARNEGRSLSATELEELQACTALAMKARGGGSPNVPALGSDLNGLLASTGPISSTNGSLAAQTPGQIFVESAGYKSIRERGEQWTTGLVEVSGPMVSLEQFKGTLLEGAGAPGSGTGGGWVPSPQVIPGMVGKLFQPLVLEDLLSSGVATTSTIRYAVEGTATSGAAGVAEGGVKPESTLAFSTLDEPIKKVATSITLSDELLEDAPAITAFVNGTLTSFVRRSKASGNCCAVPRVATRFRAS